MRRRLVERLAPFAGGGASRDQCDAGADWKSDSRRETATDFATDLANSRPEELRLRQTIVGPHRDDIEILVQGKPTASLRIRRSAANRCAFSKDCAVPRFPDRGGESHRFLLIDDIFGELDPERRNALVVIVADRSAEARYGYNHAMGREPHE